MQFELDNDDMESSKRRSIYFISLVFILKCFPKPFINRANSFIIYQANKHQIWTKIANIKQKENPNNNFLARWQI